MVKNDLPFWRAFFTITGKGYMPMNTFDYKKVKDPQYFRDARMDAHSDHIYYRTKEEAEEKQSSYRVSLNGLWKFHYAKTMPT